MTVGDAAHPVPAGVPRTRPSGRLRRTLDDRQFLLGMGIVTPSRAAVAHVGLAGFAYVFIDLEHTAINLPELDGRLLAAELTGLDLLLTPACPVTTFRGDQVAIDVAGGSVRAATPLNRCFWIANMTGWPAITVPCGFGDDGLPIVVQLQAPPMSGTLLPEAAETLEGTLQTSAERAAS